MTDRGDVKQIFVVFSQKSLKNCKCCFELNNSASF